MNWYKTSIAIPQYADRMTASNGLRVLVVDDENFVLSLLLELLETRGYTTEGVGTAAAALRQLEEFDPHVIITDLDLGDGPTGLDVLTEVARTCPWVASVVISTHRSPQLVAKGPFELPANTIYLVKNDIVDADTVDEAVQAALKGDRFAVADQGAAVQLTRTQADILRMLADGMSNSQIAAARDTSLRAVQNLISRTFEALGLADLDPATARVPAARMYRSSKVTEKPPRKQ